MKLNLKYYFLRVFLINILALVYLSDTYSFDFGFISIQSLIYSIHIYLLYFFVFFETVSAIISQYGLDFHSYKLIFNNSFSLNYDYVGYVLYENISIIYYLVFTTLIIYYLEKKKYKINLKFKSFTIIQKFYLLSFIIAFIFSYINPSLSHHSLVERIKGVTNMWTDFERNYSYHVKYYNQMVKNNFFRNENWFNALKYTFIYSGSSSAGSKKLKNIEKHNFFGNFEKFITQKKFNNIYVIINESYPNFRNQKLKNNLYQKIVLNNESLNIKKFKKKWNRSVTTQGSEMEFFCDKEVNFDEFKDTDLNIFLEKNNCWINNIKDKNFVYIHSYKESFFNRSRYKTFFDKSYFSEDLKKFSLSECIQKFSGICDHDILDNMDMLLNKKDNNFVIFLTVNNHIPLEPVMDKQYINCEKNFPLNLSKQFCTIYNNQMFFNESISNFLLRMKKNDLFVLFSDTPPMFSGKRRIHFEDTVDVYFISKI